MKIKRTLFVQADDLESSVALLAEHLRKQNGIRDVVAEGTTVHFSCTPHLRNRFSSGTLSFERMDANRLKISCDLNFRLALRIALYAFNLAVVLIVLPPPARSRIPVIGLFAAGFIFYLVSETRRLDRVINGHFEPIPHSSMSLESPSSRNVRWKEFIALMTLPAVTWGLALPASEIHSGDAPLWAKLAAAALGFLLLSVFGLLPIEAYRGHVPGKPWPNELLPLLSARATLLIFSIIAGAAYSGFTFLIPLYIWLTRAP